MASQTTKTNLLLKYLEQIFGNQQISELSGAYDPAMDMPDVPTSATAEMYLKSSNPDLQEIFSGLASGNLDTITAKQRLSALQADPNGGYNNVPVAHLLKDVDAVMKELNTPSKKEKDQYQKAGLPNPSKSYTDAPEMAPIGLNAATNIIQGNDLEKLYASSLNAAKRPKRGSIKGSSRSAEGVPDWMARSLANMDPQYMQAAQEDLAKRQAYQQKVQAAYLTGNAQNLANAGRTPYSDATLKNAAFLKTILGK
jgi:hypothetical protein